MGEGGSDLDLHSSKAAEENKSKAEGFSGHRVEEQRFKTHRVVMEDKDPESKLQSQGLLSLCRLLLKLCELTYSPRLEDRNGL